MTIKFWSSAVLLTVSVCLTQFIGFSQQAEESIPLDPEVRYGKLDNGFTYFIKKNNTPADKVHLRLVIKAGSNYEDADQLGVAHLLEHVAFNGTKNYPNDKLIEYFNSIGFVPGTSWNAGTGFDVTDYQLDFSSDNPKILANCLQVLRDWAGNMQLDPKEIDDERGVVLGESRSKANPSVELDNLIKSRLFNHPRYSANETEKHDKSINTSKTDALQRFYRDWYRPDREAIIIVGDINVEDMENKIKALFSDLKMPDHPRKVEDFASRYAVELKKRNQLISIKDKNLQEITVKIYQQRKAALKRIRNITDMRLSFIDELYNYMVRWRLTQLMQRDERLFSNVGNYIRRNAFDGSPQLDVLSTIITFKKNQSIQAGIKSIVSELNRVATYGFLSGELAEAIRISKNNIRKQSTAPTNVSIVDKCRDYFIYGAAAPFLEEELRLKMEILDKITLQEINNIAKSWINDHHNTAIVMLSPNETRIPDQSTIFKWIASGQKIKFPAYLQPEIITGNFIEEGKLLPVDVKTAIKKNSTDNELGLRNITFNNGMQLLLKRYKNSEFRKLNLKGFRMGGLANYKDFDLVNATNSRLIKSNLATGKYDKFQLEKLLKENNIKLDLGLGKNAALINGSCGINGLEILLQLLYLQMTEPSKDVVAFETRRKYWKEEMLIPKDRLNLSPESSFQDSVNKLLFKNDIPTMYSAKENLDKVNLDRVYEIYQNEFGDPSDFTFILTGDFDEEKTLGLFVKYFGYIKSKRDGHFPDTARHFEFKSAQKKTFYMGNNLGANVELFFPGEYEHSLRRSLILRMLNNAIDFRMRNRLREKEGGTYHVSSQLRQGSDFGNAYSFFISFECEVQNVEPMIKAALEEFNKLKTDGLDGKMFNQVKKLLKDEIQDQLKNNWYWEEYLTRQCMTGRDFDQILKQSSILDLITPEEIDEAVKEYLSDRNMMRFVMMPEKYRFHSINNK